MMKIRLVTLLGVCITALACGGCAFLIGGTSKEAAGEIRAPDTGQPILPGELDELTRALADRYVGLLASACEVLIKDNPDPGQRREAQDLLVDGATNVYDIASNADAFTRTLDLTVVITLVSQVWIDDDRAAAVFPDRDEVLVRALHQGRVEAWDLAAQVLRPEQLDLLDYLLWDWRRHNPGMVRTSFVRFSNFAIGRGQAAIAEVAAAGGLLGGVEALASGGLLLSAILGSDPANVGEAGKSLDEARLLTERMFYMLKRAPTLLRWQVAAAHERILATPEVGKALVDMNRLTDQVEDLPENIAAERQAIVAILDERKDLFGDTLSELRGVLSDANMAATTLDQASRSLDEMLVRATAFISLFIRPDDASSTTPPHPFDIREYTVAAESLTVAANKINDMLRSSEALIGSSEWDHRLQQVNDSADDRMRMAAKQSEQVLHDIFWRACVVVGMLCATVIVCLALALLILRRRRGRKNAGQSSQVARIER